MKTSKLSAIPYVEHGGGTYVRLAPKSWFLVCQCGCGEATPVAYPEQLEDAWQQMIRSNEPI